MSNEQHITIIGRLTADPELRFTAAGHPVANFTVASNARKFDKTTNDWKDEPANFWRCNAWREMAENVAESLTKGMAVILTGEVKSRAWETKEGEKRTTMEVEVTAIGPDLRWATAKVTRAASGGTSNGQATRAQAEDPWAKQPAKVAAPATSGWGNDPTEPPF